jgi:hypothetical protein
LTQNIVQLRLDVEKTTINKSVSTHLKNISPDEELKKQCLTNITGKNTEKS